MKPRSLILAAFIFSGLLFSQDKPEPSPSSVTEQRAGKLHVYRIGGDVKPPRALETPSPAAPEDQQNTGKVKYEGVALIDMIVDPEGKPRDIKIEKSLGAELDKKAIEAVKNWRFEPATKKGKPVAVEIKVEVTFRLR
jgi:protein TonB